MSKREQPGRVGLGPAVGDGVPSAATPAAKLPVLSKASAVLGAELIGRVARGDREALGELYDLYSCIIYALAVRTIEDQDEAEAVVESVFHDIWVDSCRFDGATDDPLGWAVRITRGRALDRLRSCPPPRLSRPVTGFANHIEEGEPTVQDHQVLVNGCDPIASAMSELPYDQRHALELLVFRGLTPTEIGEERGEEAGTIRQRIHRAMMQLWKALPYRT